MGPASAEIDIDVPRSRVFEAVSDLARRPAFMDHFVAGFRLTRIESSGIGAGARFRFRVPPRAVWTDTAIAELEEPYRVVEHGCGGRTNRIPSTTVWELLEGPGLMTRVRVSHWTEPAYPLDKLIDSIGATTLWYERGWREALRRLRDQLESETPSLRRVGVAGGNPHATGIP